MDGVHAIRDRVGADLVHLIAVSEDVCGIAAAIASNADTAFGFTDHRCGGYTFVHELGHNMGLQHARYEACRYGGCSNWPTVYSYGYVNQRAFAAGAAVESRWHTIMAYRDQCTDESIHCAGSFVSRIQQTPGTTTRSACLATSRRTAWTVRPTRCASSTCRGTSWRASGTLLRTGRRSPTEGCRTERWRPARWWSSSRARSGIPTATH